MSTTRSTPLSHLPKDVSVPDAVPEEDDRLVQDILNQINASSPPAAGSTDATLPTITHGATRPMSTAMTMPVSIPDALPVAVPLRDAGSVAERGWLTPGVIAELRSAAFIAASVVVVHYMPIGTWLEGWSRGRPVSPLHKIVARAALTAALALALRRALS